MHLHKGPFLWLLEKELRELLISRAWWLLLLLTGPLVGMSFISAARTYAEISGLNGAVGGVGEAMSPLIGVWGPTFSACELIAVFLLPFVAIRVIGGDRRSGALKLELQHELHPLVRVGAKALVLLAAWLIVLLAPGVAIGLWAAQGGALYAPEIGTIIAAHLLNAALTIALAAAAASVAEHPSTAAIATLSVTVGTWIISFFAAVQGGWWEVASGFTPSAMVADFQHGLVKLNVVLIAVSLVVAGLGLAAIWLRVGVDQKRRVLESLALAAAASVAIAAFVGLSQSWDTSESRSNSFPAADERVLRNLNGPLRIEIHLAAQDPRRLDVEQKALSKLRRVLPRTEITYVAATSTGLFEQSNEHYGEIFYFFGGRQAVSRATSAEGVLEAVYDLAGVSASPDADAEPFRGHPLARPPNGAAVTFYIVWPTLVLLGAFFAQRRRK